MPPNELRSMRLAISRRIDRALNFSASWEWAQVCGINRGHSAGRLSLPGDEGLVTSICLAVAIPVAAIGEVVFRSVHPARASPATHRRRGDIDSVRS